MVVTVFDTEWPIKQQNIWKDKLIYTIKGVNEKLNIKKYNFV